MSVLLLLIAIVAVLVLLMLGRKLFSFVCTQKVVSGVVLCCVVVPSLYFFRDLIAASVNVDASLIQIREGIHSVHYAFLDMVGDAMLRDLRTTYDKHQSRIAEIKRSLPYLEKEEASRQRIELERLSDACEELRRQQALTISEINKERLKAQRALVLKRKQAALEADLLSTYTIVRLETELSAYFSEEETAQAAAQFNFFLDAVNEGNVDRAKELVTSKLNSRMTAAALKSLKANVPAELHDSFDLRRNEESGALEVHAGSKVATLVSEDGGRHWKIDEVW